MILPIADLGDPMAVDFGNSFSDRTFVSISALLVLLPSFFEFIVESY